MRRRAHSACTSSSSPSFTSSPLVTSHVSLLILLLSLLLSLLSSPPSVAAVSSIIEVEQRDLWFSGFNVAAIAVNSTTQEVFAADISAHAIRRYNATGTYLTTYTLPPSFGDFDPTALALFGAVLYCGDESSPRIVRFDVSSGAVLSPIACPVGFLSCGAMAISPTTGDVWVADQWSLRLARLPAQSLQTPAWTLTNATTPALPVQSIDALTVDPSGSVYLSDPMTNSVLRVNLAGTAITNLTLAQPNTTTPLLQPTALAWHAASSSLYVYDEMLFYGSYTVSQTRVTQFSLSMTAASGSAVQYWYGVQPAFSAEGTLAMTVDDFGSVYYGDFGDPATQGRVLKVFPAGSTTFLAPPNMSSNAYLEPSYIAYDAISCTLFFCDGYHIAQAAPDGTVLHIWPHPAGSLRLGSLVIDSTTRTLVVLDANFIVWRFSPVTGNWTAIDTTAASLSFSGDANVAVDTTGSLYITESNPTNEMNSTVVKLSPLGVRDRSFDSQINAALNAGTLPSGHWTGLSLDPTTSNLYVAAPSGVYKLSSTGAVLGILSLQLINSTATGFLFASGILYDPVMQHLFVSTAPYSIILEYDGVSCFQHGVSCSPLGTFQPTAPAILEVLGIVMGAAGTLFVTDWNAQRIVAFAEWTGEKLVLASGSCPSSSSAAPFVSSSQSSSAFSSSRFSSSVTSSATSAPTSAAAPTSTPTNPLSSSVTSASPLPPTSLPSPSVTSAPTSPPTSSSTSISQSPSSLTSAVTSPPTTPPPSSSLTSAPLALSSSTVQPVPSSSPFSSFSALRSSSVSSSPPVSSSAVPSSATSAPTSAASSAPPSSSSVTSAPAPTSASALTSTATGQASPSVTSALTSLSISQPSPSSLTSAPLALSSSTIPPLPSTFSSPLPSSSISSPSHSTSPGSPSTSSPQPTSSYLPPPLSLSSSASISPTTAPVPYTSSSGGSSSSGLDVASSSTGLFSSTSSLPVAEGGSSSSTGAPVGAIVGGVVGGLVGCCALLLLLIVLSRRKRGGGDGRDKSKDGALTPRSEASAASSLPMSRLPSQQRATATTEAEPTPSGVASASSSVSQPSWDRQADADIFQSSGVPMYSSIRLDSDRSRARDATLASGGFPAVGDTGSSAFSTDTGNSTRSGHIPRRAGHNSDHVVFVH